MIDLADFRTGLVSLPAIDGDDLPPCCFACPFLFQKEFSVNQGDDLFYFACAYSLPDKLNQAVPPCLAGGAETR